MNVLLASIGTDGDIFPYAGLGAALLDRGHQVTLLASAHYEPLAVSHGFAFHPLISTAENNALVHHPDFWNPFKTAQLSARWGVRFLRRQYELVAKLVGSDTVIVANPGVFAAMLVHETHGTPWTNLIMQPWVIPSTVAPPLMPGLTALRHAPGPVWRVFFRVLDIFSDALLSREFNRLRSELGLKPMRRILRQWWSPQRIIGLFPDWYGSPQADWPNQIRLVGFPRYDGRQQNHLSDDVLQFCKAGPAPVAFTFGTGMRHSAALFRAALEASERSGLRAIFLTKHRDQLPEQLPSSVLHCTFAPFRELFPRCAAVVHHGGIGTVAEALAAGTPQLIRPLCFDQPDNGDRIQRLGAGLWMKPRHSTPANLAHALQQLTAPASRDRCRELSRRLTTDGALAAAAVHVETLVR
jgi:rhamnosyltransferase subunit B